MNTRAALFAIAAGFLLAAAPCAGRTAAVAPLPATLAETGLFEPGTLEASAANQPFAPAYPLWSDGMDKRRWLHIPAGAAIDKSDPDAWVFPVGTRAWKEFRREGRVETRFIERLTDGSWRFASYVWNAEGTRALLAPDDGIASKGIPSRADCLACHEGAPVPILGYSAVQLSKDAIAGPTPTTRAVLGYLHGNCSHCHNDSALPALDLSLAQSAARPQESAARALITLVGRYGRYRGADSAETRRVRPGHADESMLLARLKSHDPLVRMPPIGVSVVDERAVTLIERWIAQDLRNATTTKAQEK
jgi:hypothetical protein